MSGGHYDYKYFKVQELADDIEHDFINDGKYQDTDWGKPYNWHDDERPEQECDRIGDATHEQRIEILDEIRSLISDLNRCAFRAKELEWYMSGNIGADNYLNRLKNIK